MNIRDSYIGTNKVGRVYHQDNVIYPNPIKNGLVLWYDFLGRRNTDVNKAIADDLSGNGNDGELINFAFVEGSGYENGSLMFDGIDDGIEGQIFRHRGSLTVQSTIIIRYGTGRYAPIFRLVSGTNDGFYFGITSANSNSARLWAGTTVDGDVLQESNLASVNSGEKYVLTCQIDDERKKLKIYINGELEREFDHNVVNLDYYSYPAIGRQPNISSRVLNGEIYSVLFYNRVLSDEEVHHNYRLEKERWE